MAAVQYFRMTEALFASRVIEPLAFAAPKSSVDSSDVFILTYTNETQLISRGLGENFAMLTSYPPRYQEP